MEKPSTQGLSPKQEPYWISILASIGWIPSLCMWYRVFPFTHFSLQKSTLMPFLLWFTIEPHLKRQPICPRKGLPAITDSLNPYKIVMILSWVACFHLNGLFQLSMTWMLCYHNEIGTGCMFLCSSQRQHLQENI